MTLKDGYGFGGFSRAPPSKQHLSTPRPPPPPPRDCGLTTFHISINDWLPFKYFLGQVDSTLLLASCMTSLFRRQLLPLIEGDFHSYLYALFNMIAKLWLLDDISYFDNDWLPFKYFLRQVYSTLFLAPCMTLSLRLLFFHILDMIFVLFIFAF